MLSLNGEGNDTNFIHELHELFKFKTFSRKSWLIIL